MLMAIDGFDAVKKLEELAFSLVVVDLVMPRMDGMSLLNHIRGKYPDIPVVIISGTVVAEIGNIAKAAGVVGYFRKPFQVDDLHSVIIGSLQKEADGGIMNDVSPTVFLQLIEMDAKTCTIRIFDKDSKEGGVLYFIDGRLLDARIGTLRGIEAAYKVFSWDVVTIFIGNECTPMEDKINSELQPIIMKAVGLKDESAETACEDGLSDTQVGVTDGEESVKIKRQSRIDSIKGLLQEKMEKNSGLKDIYHDGSLDDVVLSLAKIGEVAHFGHLKAGCIDNGTEIDRIILPGSPATLLEMSPNCPKDRVLQLLFENDLALYNGK